MCAASAPAFAQSPPSDQARIERLEAALQAVQAELAELKAQQAAQPAPVVANVAGDSGVITLGASVATPASKQSGANDGGATSISLGGGRPTFRTADGNFTTTLHGVMQFDTAAYDQDDPGPIATDLRRSGPALGGSASNVDLTHARDLKDGTLFRRARIGLDGTVYGDWDYRVLFDFGGAGVENTGELYESWVQYSGLRPLKIRVGAFPPSIGLDDQGSTNGMPFLERAVSSDLARGLAAGDSRIAASVFGNGDHWLASAAVTGRTIGDINTGTASAVPQTYGDQLGFVGRLAGTPLYGRDWVIHVGVHGSYLDRPADASGPGTNGATAITSSVVSLSNTPEIRVDGTKLINTGSIDARHADTLGAEFAAQAKNFFLQSEYEHFDIKRSDGLASPHFDGWYVYGTWILTGEARTYNSSTAAFDGPAVPHPFSLKNGTWGALEVAVRYSDMDLNHNAGAAGTYQTGSSIRGGETKDFTAGLNWYINPVVRFMADYQHIQIDRLSPATNATTASTIWFTPEGAQIGQSYDVFSLRTQMAF
jgi:phosphate-selective porin OprO/OprP